MVASLIELSFSSMCAVGARARNDRKEGEISYTFKHTSLFTIFLATPQIAKEYLFRDNSLRRVTAPGSGIFFD
jgi:hypothetical protein